MIWQMFELHPQWDINNNSENIGAVQNNGAQITPIFKYLLVIFWTDGAGDFGLFAALVYFLLVGRRRIQQR